MIERCASRRNTLRNDSRLPFHSSRRPIVRARVRVTTCDMITRSGGSIHTTVSARAQTGPSIVTFR